MEGETQGSGEESSEDDESDGDGDHELGCGGLCGVEVYKEAAGSCKPRGAEAGAEGEDQEHEETNTEFHSQVSPGKSARKFGTAVHKNGMGLEAREGAVGEDGSHKAEEKSGAGASPLCVCFREEARLHEAEGGKAVTRVSRGAENTEARRDTDEGERHVSVAYSFSICTDNEVDVGGRDGGLSTRASRLEAAAGSICVCACTRAEKGCSNTRDPSIPSSEVEAKGVSASQLGPRPRAGGSAKLVVNPRARKEAVTRDSTDILDMVGLRESTGRRGRVAFEAGLGQGAGGTAKCEGNGIDKTGGRQECRARQ